MSIPSQASRLKIRVAAGKQHFLILKELRHKPSELFTSVIRGTSIGLEVFDRAGWFGAPNVSCLIIPAIAKTGDIAPAQVRFEEGMSLVRCKT